MNEPMKERFLRDVAEHDIEVFLDQGPYRQMRFSRGGSNIGAFSLTTWPGHLAITGDMGDYVFARVRDMFEFFRNDRQEINASYWAEKCVASDRMCGIEQFSKERFRDDVVRWFRDWAEGRDYSERLECWEDVRQNLLESFDLDNETMAMRAAMEFEFKGRLVFQDFWEADCREYTPRFLWCCHAIVWGISVYDQRKVAA